MLMVQKFHSIHEIDPEFIPSLEILLQEDFASFDTLVQRHDRAPASDVFTYFLFFGPTQNTPIGFSQLCLRQLPWEEIVPWHKKALSFMRDDFKHWKQLTWQVGDGSSGMFVFDARFARSGKEKMQSLIKEYESRVEIQSLQYFYLKGIQDFQSSWSTDNTFTKECFVLEPLMKAQKTYQAYLEHLAPEIRDQIKSSWKSLHSKKEIEMGDYPTPSETPKTLPIAEDILAIWEKWGAQVLTFEKDLQVLGCLLVLKGRNGNIFFEPIPFEAEDGSALISDDLYTQYALLKFFEMPEARKCHMMKFGTKLVFDDKDDLKFFKDQGFQHKTVTQLFSSKLPTVTKPI
jgi:hypothetical protein